MSLQTTEQLYYTPKRFAYYQSLIGAKVNRLYPAASDSNDEGYIEFDTIIAVERIENSDYFLVVYEH